MRYLLFLLLFPLLSFGQGQMYKASVQQASGGYSDAITVLSPDIYFNNTSIDATATIEGDDVDIWSDLSGNGDHATQTGTVSPELHLDGSSNRQVTFDGTDWLDIADASVCDYTLGTDEFTIIIREGDVNGTSGAFVSKAVTTSADRLFVVYHSGDANNWIVNHGGTASTFGIPTGGGTNRLIIITFTTTQVRLYADGTESTSGPFTLDTTAASHASQSVNIGGRTDGGFLYTGDIDLVAIIPTALDGTQRASVESEFQVN